MYTRGVSIPREQLQATCLYLLFPEIDRTAAVLSKKLVYMYCKQVYNSNKVNLYKTLRKSKIPDRMRGCWDRKVTGTHILVHILCLRENYLVVYNELKFK